VEAEREALADEWAAVTVPDDPIAKFSAAQAQMPEAAPVPGQRTES
jgi:hypothetical protein